MSPPKLYFQFNFPFLFFYCLSSFLFFPFLCAIFLFLIKNHPFLTPKIVIVERLERKWLVTRQQFLE
uniref:Uncharacterized protein n=1 Tax=Meloidogyne enterolobii TaxID=390850 RepID=A0A6V7TLV1_MELEN|nr:unnamed protein product [Meloidogyne enterolobii]